MTMSYYGADSRALDEADIRRLIAKWSKALEVRDLDTMMADYLPNAVLFDAVPPYKTVGAENIRKLWEACFPYFPEVFTSEHRDINIRVAGNLAYVHCLHHFIPRPEDHPCGKSWMRVTVCYHRVNHQWKVAHEHVSLPFNPIDNQVWAIRDPDIADTPEVERAHD